MNPIPGRRAATREAPGDEREQSGSLSYVTSVDIRPAAISLEDYFAAFASKDDLEVPPPDRGGVAAAHRTGRHLVLERRRQWLDLDL
jgi:hypothetical protein